SEQYACVVREAFFRYCMDISDQKVLNKLAEQNKLPVKKINQVIKRGEAYASLHIDDQLRQQYKVPGSPTLVLNEGRQMLYGNVGYRIIESNIVELLRSPETGEPSWC
ncbi:MAG: DsbA family oxidoreductase, partial [bacterium]